MKKNFCKPLVGWFFSNRNVVKCLIITLLLMFNSCSNEKSIAPVSTEINGEISVEQAKAMYERQMRSTQSAKTTKRKRKETPLWDAKQYITLYDGSKALIATVEEERDALTLVSFDNDTTSKKSFEELYTTVKVAAYKDPKGKEHIERMYIKADVDYARRKKFRSSDTDFTGRIWFEDFDDNFLREFKYVDGKLISIVKPMGDSDKNARSTDLICTVIFENVTQSMDYYTICSEGDCPPTFMYNSTSGNYFEVLFASCYDEGQGGQSGPGGTGALNIEDPGFWEWWGQINQLERDWLLSNPGKAYTAYENYKRADVSSRQRFGGAVQTDEDGTNQNAYKHAYAAALHTLSWGPNIGLEIVNNHEGGPLNLATATLAQRMDHHNNALGINLVNMCGCDGEVLRDLIQSQIGQGQGRRIVYGNGQQSNTLMNTTSANLDND
ncbi:hypothetical protein [uncultured Chryseobacterium sp.]|uniref:DUF6973 domain-containing protein n=1 Tax=uncultured Chryseobacterium sp. TaxID=259322 RepID=UPI00258DB489|nr:hypothetical protein [uncultured Chryseobacterium sp.]